MAIFSIMVAFPIYVGLGQMLLFKGQSRRDASIVAGAMFCEVLVIVLLGSMILIDGTSPSWQGFRDTGPAVFYAVFYGGILGYLTGSAISCVLKGAHRINRYLAARRLRIEEENSEEGNS